jgi:hypothetical protein
MSDKNNPTSLSVGLTELGWRNLQAKLPHRVDGWVYSASKSRAQPWQPWFPVGGPEEGASASEWKEEIAAAVSSVRFHVSPADGGSLSEGADTTGGGVADAPAVPESAQRRERDLVFED